MMELVDVFVQSLAVDQPMRPIEPGVHYYETNPQLQQFHMPDERVALLYPFHPPDGQSPVAHQRQNHRWRDEEQVEHAETHRLNPLSHSKVTFGTLCLEAHENRWAE